jgi:peptidoglycan/xylan/chitin deacetylase (PgdA/CDA1 family)
MSFLLIKNKMPALTSFNRASLPSPVRTMAALGNIGLTETNLDRSICLTFDDGPDPVYTQKILNVLADYDVKATFFVLSEAAEQFPHLLQQMLKAGHAIGNHTYSHRHPWMMSSERAKYEVAQANTVIKDITGIAPRWFRPPFGRLRTAMRRQAHIEHMTTVLWSRSIIDWGMLGTKTGIARRLEHIKPGDIVLMHDGRPGHNHPGITVQCLPKFLQSLSEKSLVACSLDEVFGGKI